MLLQSVGPAHGFICGCLPLRVQVFPDVYLTKRLMKHLGLRFVKALSFWSDSVPLVVDFTKREIFSLEEVCHYITFLFFEVT